VAAILPTSLMIIFSLLAYKNIRQIVRKIRPISNSIAAQEIGLGQNIERIRHRQSSRELSKMLFIQIIVYMIFTISYPIQTLYSAVTLIIGEQKSTEKVAIENFTLFLTSGFLLNFYSASSFFVFLTSSAFRTGLRKVFASITTHYYCTGNRRESMAF
jgi:hypothetical protein